MQARVVVSGHRLEPEMDKYLLWVLGETVTGRKAKQEG